MTSLQKLGYLAHLDVQIVLANLETETHLLHIKRFGGLAVLLQLLGPLVVELTPIDNFANWRIGIG